MGRLLINLFTPMRFKTGDTAILSKEIKITDTILPYHSKVEIIFVDPIMRTYDILYNGVEYTDFSDSDFE